MDGFVSTKKTTGDVDLDPGILLSPENRAFNSVGLCDVDENGVQYMLLCRAILGNVGSITPGSHEFPSSDIYDSVADNCSNPSCYLIRTSHLSTHICLEYLISFRLAPNDQEYLGQKGLLFLPPPKQGLVDLSNIQPITCQATEGPTSPWVSFKVLFETVQGNLSPVARELLFLHYEELKEKKITRKEMVKKMMLIIGEKLLVDSLTKLDKNNPSLWYKSPAKVATDTINTTVNSICINTSMIDQHATPIHDYLAPSIVPVKCEPMDSQYGGSPQLSVSLNRHEFPSPRMYSQNLSAHCPRLGTNGHAPLTQNSASIRMKGLHSVTPGIASKVPEPLPTGLVPECISSPSSKGGDAATSSISPRIQSPSILHGSCARSMAPHFHVPSMAPHLRIPSKTSQAQAQGVTLQSFEKSVTLQAQYSGAGTMIPVSSTPPTPTGAPKGNATPTSSEEPNHHQTPELGTRAKGAALSVARKSPERTANLTAEEHKDSTLKSAVSSNVVSQCVASNTIPIAADVLVGLSGQYKKGR